MRKFIFLVVLLALSITGCRVNESQYISYANFNKKLSEKHKDLIQNASLTKYNLDSTELVQWQADLLDQILFIEKELKRKYPSYSLELNLIIPKDTKTQFTTASFYEKKNPLILYSLEVADAENGEYLEADNFWCKAIRQKYEEYLKEYLKENNIKCIQINALLSGLEGSEFTEYINIADLIDNKYEINQILEIIVDANNIQEDEYAEYCELIADTLKKMKLSGYYTILIYDADGSQVVFSTEIKPLINEV